MPTLQESFLGTIKIRLFEAEFPCNIFEKNGNISTIWRWKHDTNFETCRKYALQSRTAMEFDSVDYMFSEEEEDLFDEEEFGVDADDLLDDEDEDHWMSDESEEDFDDFDMEADLDGMDLGFDEED